MSPSGRLRLLTILGLILPTRGQMLENTLGPHVLTQVPDKVHPEVQSTPETGAQPTDETTQSQNTILTETPLRTGIDFVLVTDPRTLVSSKEATLSDPPTEGTTESIGRPSPGKDTRTDSPSPSSSGSDEDNPFHYDETTLRRRGLLVAAVLFITGIIILTSGKCRQLSQMCRNRRR